MTKKAAPKPRPRPLRDAIHRATAPPAPPAPAPVKTPPLEELTCDWTADAAGTTYTTACARAWTFAPGNGPVDAAWKVCPFCGKLLAVR